MLRSVVYMLAGGLIAVTGGAVLQSRSASSAEEKAKAAAVARPTGFVDLVHAIRQSHRGRIGMEAINTFKKVEEEKIAAFAKELESKSKAAAAETLPDEKARLEREALKAKQRMETSQQDLARELNARGSKVIGALYKELKEAGQEVAKERGLGAVLVYPADRTQADNPVMHEAALRPPALMPLYVHPDYDVTDDVIERLNKKYANEK